MHSSKQKTLTAAQLREFYHDDFLEDQIRDFQACLFPDGKPFEGVIVDVGGGGGYFAQALKEKLGYQVRVVDADSKSVNACLQRGIDATIGDCASMQFNKDDRIICFNLILHHLVADNEEMTIALQSRTLRNCHGNARKVFVNEYIYESYINNFSGLLIYKITSSAILSAIGKTISRIVPSFRANTFGTGVRFRSHEEWRRLFQNSGLSVSKTLTGMEEKVDLPLRLLLIKSIRRDSFLLESDI